MVIRLKNAKRADLDGEKEARDMRWVFSTGSPRQTIISRDVAIWDGGDQIPIMLHDALSRILRWTQSMDSACSSARTKHVYSHLCLGIVCGLKLVYCSWRRLNPKMSSALLCIIFQLASAMSQEFSNSLFL